MNEQQCLAKMVAPSQKRIGKPRGGVIQIHVTRACDKACCNCTQGSGFARKVGFMTPEQFDLACASLKGYFGIVGVFGGNPALSPHFADYCRILSQHFPFEQRGLWCNHPRTIENAWLMRQTFNLAVSNLNVHLDQEAYDLFRAGWPESNPFGLHEDSRHGPVFVSMKDLNIEESQRWELISRCDINQHWSALIGVFRGELRAWFCEVAGAQAMLHQDEPDYPDTGYCVSNHLGAPDQYGFGRMWWQLPMLSFQDQVRKHCHNCSVPLRGYGELAVSGNLDQVSAAHPFHSKRKGREVQTVTQLTQLDTGRLRKATDYLGNAKCTT